MSVLVFNRRLFLEEKQKLADGAGGYSESWVVLGTHWGAIRADRGRVRGSGGVEVSTVPYRIVVRAAAVDSPARPKPGQRFRDDTRIFSVEAVADNVPGPLFVTCYTKEEIAA